MPAESSTEKRTSGRSPSFDLSAVQRLFMVGLAYVPMGHMLLALGTGIAIWRSYGAGYAIVSGAAALYLIPPLAVAVVRPRALLANPQYQVGTSEFFRWWYTAQWQVMFNRFPQLEELLRLVPGMYSTWLRLWGARIGGLVYWSPGLIVFDRPFLNIGRRVVIGADTKLSPHFLMRGATGATELVVAPITIGDDAMIGGSTLLPAGVTVGDREQTPGGRPMAPFSRFEGGQHIRTSRFYKEPRNDA
jgi:hypothetical protein